MSDFHAADSAPQLPPFVYLGKRPVSSKPVSQMNGTTWWGTVIEPGEGFGYHRKMPQTLRRLLIVAAVIWLAIWCYVGWRGHELTSDAHRFTEVLPPGAHVPEGVLSALEAGETYTLDAVIWGAAVPLIALLIGWLLKPLLRERYAVRH